MQLKKLRQNFLLPRLGLTPRLYELSHLALLIDHKKKKMKKTILKILKEVIIKLGGGQVFENAGSIHLIKIVTQITRKPKSYYSKAYNSNLF